METKFIFLKEDTKFWIVSSVVGLAILFLIFLSAADAKNHTDLGVENTGEIKYYSRILGTSPVEDFWSGNISSDVQNWNKWQRGDIAYAANIK
jgi:hypothetical protein